MKKLLLLLLIVSCSMLDGHNDVVSTGSIRDYLFPIQDYDPLTNPNLVQTLYW